MRKARSQHIDVCKAFALLCRCCAPITDGVLEEIDRAGNGIDWPTFVGLARRHRVEALVFDRLSRGRIAMPPAIRSILKEAAQRIAIRSMLHVVEAQRLVETAEAAGLAPVILKGAPLALLGHGAVHLKHAKDIDLAVPPNDLAAMRALLSAAGYQCHRVGTGKDESWVDAIRGSEVELHTALVDHSARLQSIVLGPEFARQRVGSGRGLPTLVSDDLYAYLCVHGAGHGWSRLKWLADIAALLARQVPETIAAWHAHAVSLGAERASAQTLLLCRELLGLSLPGKLGDHLERQVIVRWLVADARRAFTARHALEELDARTLSTVRIHLAQLMMTSGWSAQRQLLFSKLGGSHFSASFVARWLLQRIRVARSQGIHA